MWAEGQCAPPPVLNAPSRETQAIRMNLTSMDITFRRERCSADGWCTHHLEPLGPQMLLHALPFARAPYPAPRCNSARGGKRSQSAQTFRKSTPNHQLQPAVRVTTHCTQSCPPSSPGTKCRGGWGLKVSKIYQKRLPTNSKGAV